MAQPVINPDTPLPSDPETSPPDEVGVTDKAAQKAAKKRRRKRAAGNAAKAVSSPWASLVAIIIALLWTLPTLGLFVTSFRTARDINETGWWHAFVKPWFTMKNYEQAMFGSSTSLIDYFVNSLVITIPAVMIPMLLATIAAYAFAWIKFPGRDILFVMVFALQVVPLQVALIPLLQFFNRTSIDGFWRVWLAHGTFALPLAVFLLHNFMKDLPGELLEAARVDGAGHVQIFTRIMLPLLTPAIASFGIFQFLWVWNDLLVALIFLGGTRDVAPLTVRVAELSGTLGSSWHLLAAGAFISMIVPVVVFLALQRYFVRGLLAGGLKG
ncbi:carbohydrate ABC transporter permease [Propionibacteriaceae bacterium Y1923]